MRWPFKSLPNPFRRFVPLGDRGERLARRFLKQAGLRILQSNYTCPIGEIDIIAADGDVLVFVEVKTLTSDEENDPERAVNRQKKIKLTKVAKYFINQKNANNMTARFDVVAVVVPDKGKPVITHFVDAFSPKTR